jgi:hypothetical protein
MSVQAERLAVASAEDRSAQRVEMTVADQLLDGPPLREGRVDLDQRVRPKGTGD